MEMEVDTTEMIRSDHFLVVPTDKIDLTTLSTMVANGLTKANMKKYEMRNALLECDVEEKLISTLSQGIIYRDKQKRQLGINTPYEMIFLVEKDNITYPCNIVLYYSPKLRVGRYELTKRGDKTLYFHIVWINQPKGRKY